MLLQLYTKLVSCKVFIRPLTVIRLRPSSNHCTCILRDFPNKLGNISTSDIVGYDLLWPENSANGYATERD